MYCFLIIWIKKPGMGSERREYSVFGVSRITFVLAWAFLSMFLIRRTVRLTCNIPDEKSMSENLRPQTSPILSPVYMAIITPRVS